MNAQPSLGQIPKRRLEFGVDVETFRLSDRRFERASTDGSMDEDDVITKRRRRLLDDERHEELRRRPHPIHRPQIMRQSDKDDETLIRETQAALKTLSGNWTRNPSPLHSADENDDANGFENLFNDKRSDKMLPSSPSQSSESADASQRSYSYRSHQAEEPITNGNHDVDIDNENQNESDRAKSEEYEEHTKYSSYDAANFDELGDSSSNELEIDMSDRCEDDEMASKYKRKSETVSVNKQSLYNAYKAATAALPYSTQSAFKPPAEVKHRLHNPSLPSEPFGGYSNDHEKSLQKASKQYTVLQPAGAGSRAATALQEARAVPTAQPARDSRPLAALSPPAARGIGRLPSDDDTQTSLTTCP